MNAERATAPEDARLPGLSLFHASIEPMSLATVDGGRFLDVNQSFCELFGWERHEVVGRTVSDIEQWEDPGDRDRLIERLRAAERLPVVRARFRRKGGAPCVADITAQLLEIQGVEYLFATFRDVTDMVAAEEALRESEARFRALSDATREGLGIQADGRIIVANRALAEMFGYREEELIGMKGIDLLVPEAHERAIERGRTGDEEPWETTGVRADGSTFPIEIAARNVQYEGRPARVASVRDLSERKRAEEELLAREHRFRAMIEHSSDSIVLVNEEGRVTYQSPQAEREFGYPNQEAVGLLGLEQVHPDDYERIGRMFNELVGSPGASASGELRVRHRDGSWRWVEAVATNLLEEPGVHAIVTNSRDVTDRKAADDALRDAESRYRNLVESIPAVLYLDQFDPTSTSIYVSPQAERLFGYPIADWDADPLFWVSLVHPDDKEWVLARQAELEAHPQAYSFDYRMIAAGERVVWVHDEGVPIRDAEGNPRYWQGFWIDVTAAHEAQDALRSAEERYRMVVENAHDMITLIDLDGRILFVSPSCREVLGYDPEEIVGKRTTDLAHPDDLRLAQTSLANLRGGSSIESGEIRLRHKNGGWVHIEGAARSITDREGNTVLLSTSRDVSERRRLDADRRRLLARLVAAQEEERTRIAEDIHDDPIQVMTAAGMRLAMLRSKLEGAAGQEEVEKIEEVVERAIGRLRHLLFELHPPALDREGLAGAIGDYLRALIDIGSEFRFNVEDRLAEEPPTDIRVVCYRIVQEALVNVRKHAQATRTAVVLDTVDGGTRVRIEDDGVGISQEPSPARGHMGLDAMRERAELAGGWLKIASPNGSGTVVEFWVPNAPAEEPD